MTFETKIDPPKLKGIINKLNNPQDRTLVNNSKKCNLFWYI